MPMNFPDLESLKRRAKLYKFRDIKDDESEDEYRIALADRVAPIDLVESMEIRTKLGWDQWNDEQKKDMLRRAMSNVLLNK